jgi:hypothetical protein
VPFHSFQISKSGIAENPVENPIPGTHTAFLRRPLQLDPAEVFRFRLQRVDLQDRCQGDFLKIERVLFFFRHRVSL